MGRLSWFQFGNPGTLGFALCILASHPFRKERGKNGAPHFVCDLELRVGMLGWPGPILRVASLCIDQPGVAGE